MPRLARLRIACMSALALVPAAAFAAPLSVEVWTDRGTDAVYQPGDLLEIQTRVSSDAYLLVYEIDAEGFVHLLYPAHAGASNRIEGERTYRIPGDAASDLELVVQEPVGQGYIVSVASVAPFGPLPWYLRPYDPQAEAIGYEGEPNEEEGITQEGRIVGDPFVAMERIRRRVVADPNDIDDFGTAYTTYYVHERVRYPRYLCYDCHRPDYWAWWDGFDPYYTHCSVFDFRVNWSWAWGPAYWCGSIPYYVYTVRYDCPPHYRDYGGAWYSAWDGWGRWCNLWGPLTRYKSPPPPDYIPPDRYREAHWRDRGGPPGFLTSRVTRGNGARVSLPIGHNRPARGENEGAGTRTRSSGLRLQKPGQTPDPVRQANGDPDALRPRGETERPRPAGAPREEGGVRVDRNRRESAAPVQRPRSEQPQSPRYTPRNGERNAPPPRYTPPPSDDDRSAPPPRGRNEAPPREGGRNAPPPREGGDSSPPPQATRPPRNDPPPSPPPRGNDSGVQRGAGGKGGSGTRGASYQRGGGGRSGGGSRSARPSRSGGSGARGNRG